MNSPFHPCTRSRPRPPRAAGPGRHGRRAATGARGHAREDRRQRQGGARRARGLTAHGLTCWGAGEKYVGYHVELCERVLKDIVPAAKLEYMAVTAQNTIPLVQNGTLDIGCGPTATTSRASSRWPSRSPPT